ncbi:DUF6443 domain-containing protein [Xanthocytophaga flava]|uniref:DUF6443 domain-containing protein n=1 Tax=Xanthocytophaga flava TaxID=3048013 RepID=UPI0028D31678|nr:DUF6443 domain-containing protein [Xanthocytophaga flavus]MDJ1470360.1 DUF6443 domain-containing protein [Xanthocytophaga flavus]
MINYSQLKIALLSVALIMLSSLKAQVRNYTRVENIRVSGVKNGSQIDALPVESKRVSFNYTNDLGRPAQKVSWQSSPTKTDEVKYFIYDLIGREQFQYMPYTSTTADGSFKADASSSQPAFYQSLKSDNKAYLETRFELSPLSRVLEQGSVGTAWQLGGTDPKTTKISYSKNTVSEIRKWKYIYSNGTTYHVADGNAFYDAGELSVTQTTNVQGLKSIKYTDKEGKLICIKEQRVKGSESSYLITYYVYDQIGNLWFTLPPEAIANLATINYTFSYQDAFCRKWVFANIYDSRFRLLEKSVPVSGSSSTSGVTYFVYDPLDRIILTQDATERIQKRWSFIKYDQQGRQILLGRYTHSSAMSQVGMQQFIDNYYVSNPALKPFEYRSNANFSLLHGYTNQAFPVMPTIRTADESNFIGCIHYYDDYDYNYNGIEFEINNGEVAFATSAPTGAVALPSDFTLIYGSARNKKTGSKLILNKYAAYDNTAYQLESMFYDNNGRLIQMSSRLSNSLTDKEELYFIQYDFEGKIVKKAQYHNGGSHAFFKRYTYDHAGRSKDIYMQVNAEPEQKLVTYNYNAVGEMVQKVIGNNLQTIEYTYNIKGWLQSINDAALTDASDLFGMQLDYETAPKPMYNGAIGKQTWRTATDGRSPANISRTYNYTYDGLTRLTDATYSSSVSGEDYSLWTSGYTDNGNLLDLARKNLISRTPNGNDTYGYVDLLTFTYQGNALKAVDDNNSASPSLARDFREKSKSTINPTEYSYDEAGRLKANLNSEIYAIGYDDDDRPVYVTGEEHELNGEYYNNYLFNSYLYSGEKKSSKITIDGSDVKITDYKGGVVYENNVIQYLPHEEGRVLSPQVTGKSTWTYEYFYTDHLGSLRVAFRPGENVSYLASMETESAPAWSNASTPIRNNEQAFSGSYSAKLTTVNPLGPWKTIKVGKGDKITVRAKAKYTSSPTSNNAISLVTYVNGLGSQPTETGNKPPLLSLGLAITPLAINSVQNTIPKAYLEYILQTSESEVIQSKRQYITSAAANSWEYQEMSYVAETNGYFQILVANESDKPVWFDDVELIVQQSMISQETHYDPFGVELAGIEKRDNPEMDFKFQGKELIDDIGLYWMDFGARYYDPQLGRWHVNDAMASEAGQEVYSPYAAMLNNPVSTIDPDGNCPICPFIIAGAIIGGSLGGIKADMEGKNVLAGIGKGLVIGAASGVASYFAPIGFLPGFAYGAGTGAVLGGASAALDGTNIGRGALIGGITGGIMGGIRGGIEAVKLGGDFMTGQRPIHDFTAEEIESLSLSGTGVGDKPVKYDEASLKAFAKKQFENGRGSLTMKYMPAKYKMHPDNDGSWLNPDKPDKKILGATMARVWKHGQIGGNIYISKAAFVSEKQLFITVGHEYTHAQHAFDRLPILYKKGDGYYDNYDDMTERAAYEWTLRAAAENKWYGIYNDYAPILQLNQYNMTVPDVFKSRMTTVFTP